MENYVKDFVVEYSELVKQAQRTFILSKKKAGLDNETFKQLQDYLSLLEKACGLVEFERTNHFSTVAGTIA